MQPTRLKDSQPLPQGALPVLHEDNGCGCGCAIFMLCVFAVWMMYSMFKGFGYGQNIFYALIPIFVVLTAGGLFFRTRLFIDASRRCVVRWRRGLTEKTDDIPFDNFKPISVRTASDSGIFHAVKLETSDKVFAEKKFTAPGEKSYVESRALAREWAAKLERTVEDWTTNRALARDAAHVGVPLRERLRQLRERSGVALTLPERPIPCAIENEPGDHGEAVFRLLPSRALLKVNGQRLYIDRGIILINPKIEMPLEKVMDIEVQYFKSDPQKVEGLMIQSAQHWVVIGSGCSEEDLIWLRDTLHCFVAA